MAKQKDVLLFSLKWFISLAILAYLLLVRVPLAEVGAALKDARLFWLICSFSLHALGVLVSAIRWQILIQAQGDRVPLGFLAKSYLVGTFFNNFLPTRFGGDIVRIWDGSRYSRSLLKSTAIVLVERLTGVIVLLGFALSAALLRLDMAQQIPFVLPALILSLGGLAFIIGFFTPAGSALLRRLPERGFLVKFKAKVAEFRKVVQVYATERRAFFRALFWAVLLQINVIMHYYLAGLAFRLTIPLVDYFIFIPLMLLILTIPITIGGLGLREFLYIEVFVIYGIAQGTALSFSLIADFVFTLIIGMAGALIYAVRKAPAPAKNQTGSKSPAEDR